MGPPSSLSVPGPERNTVENGCWPCTADALSTLLDLLFVPPAERTAQRIWHKLIVTYRAVRPPDLFGCDQRRAAPALAYGVYQAPRGNRKIHCPRPSRSFKRLHRESSPRPGICSALTLPRQNVLNSRAYANSFYGLCMSQHNLSIAGPTVSAAYSPAHAGQGSLLA